ncbi:hypothetical protein TVAG_446340 [Trichomonas vaginalis G3]|uniref:Uncharacterized protein n=1 Tax=Trichomonas vaginalis (strain ATCC PRA-98 / G3) TaxID=412133 RepID=A2GAB8_TRIV3|nr:hypothetical protein TVAGG3_1033250 [Trichomonas vaginalis G3]EAX85901.1 hypothetical protein TVAG_446340 [Trichomonas vaginalis G3]KAI5493024.1 hypothetical protein TVAGG3_1033250 [Trichomonas vaginalis G3]|eukprot:XP_001298831.1 hypothetical protein [Trichomonas vaginalis G3]
MYQTTPTDDTNINSLDSTFNSEEIISILKPILAKNINSEKLKTNILSKVIKELKETSLAMKTDRINRRIQQITNMINDTSPNRRSDEEINMRLNAVLSEIFDILSFVQMLSGLNPQGAKDFKICVNFLEAFHFLYKIMQMIKWVRPIPRQVHALRDSFETSCMQIFTSILNQNIMNFDCQETLNNCLSILLEVDVKGVYSQNMIPPLRVYYEKIQYEAFKANPTIFQLNAVLGQAMRNRNLTDLTKYIDMLEVAPTDPRKVFILISKMGQMPELKQCVINAALKCRSPDALCQAYQFFHDNVEIQQQYLTVLANISSNWLNQLLTYLSRKFGPDSTDHISSEHQVRSSYSQMRKMVDRLGEEMKRYIFQTMAESDSLQSIFLLYKSGNIDLNSNDDMFKDLLLIFNLIPVQ